MLRVASPLVGLALLALVVWLGFRSADDPGFIVWFGLASAIVAPAGLACIGLPLRQRNDQVLRDLSSVADMQDLIAQAHSEQERLQLLEDERQRLSEIVRVEARRQSLEEQRSMLLDNAARTLAALDAIDVEAVSLRLDLKGSAVLPEVRALTERLEARQEGKVILRLGDRFVALDPDFLGSGVAPFGLGGLFASLLRGLASWQSRRSRGD